jgi:NTE family protein
MTIVERFIGRRQPRAPRRVGLALAGGGVIGGMYEVGALAALEERINGVGRGFDVYVGCSAGSVVASLLANGVRAGEIFRILDEDLPDALNFRRHAVFAPDAFRHAATRFGQLVWVFGKNLRNALRTSIPDMLAQAERDLPAGFFTLAALERFVREGFATRGLTNNFGRLPRPLLIPAIDLDRASRVVFGKDGLVDVPISQAVAASSAIPGFFEPYTIQGCDYVDGGVGFTGHADLAADDGVDTVFIVNPLVPTMLEGAMPIRLRGVYSIMEQTSRIHSQNLLSLGMERLALRYPRTRFFLLQPPRDCDFLFGPSMSFDASRKALRFGYSSARDWLEGAGAELVERLGTYPTAV